MTDLITSLQENFDLEKETTPKVRPLCCENVRFYFCRHCGKVHGVPDTCNQFYCKKCYKRKFNRAYKRFMELGIKTKKLFHVIIGFPYTDFSKNDRLRHQKIMSDFRSFAGEWFNGIRVFDLGYGTTTLYYAHYHHGLLPDDVFSDVRQFRIILNKCVKDFCKKFNVSMTVRIAKNTGWRTKKGLFAYFSKRVAGLMGDESKNTEWFIEDEVPFEEYLEIFYNIKKVVILGTLRKLCSNIAHPHIKRCPFCYSTDVVLYALELNSSVDHPPPVPESLITFAEEREIVSLFRFEEV